MSGKTEWEDALMAHGIIEERVDEEALRDEEWADEQDRLEQEKLTDPYKHLYGKSLEQLKEHEDEVDEDSFEMLRRRRLEALKKKAARNIYGRVMNINEPEWKPEVTEADKDTWVLVNLYCDGKQECSLVDDIQRQLAAKFRDLKCVRIEGRNAIRNWPDSNCPALFLYKASEVKLQLIGLQSMGGMKASSAQMEWVLSRIGAVETDMTEDPAIEEQRTRFNRLEKSRKEFEDEGDDWLDE